MSEYKNPVCKGSYALGSACGTCERCAEWRDKHVRPEFHNCFAKPAAHAEKADTVTVQRARGAMTNPQSLEDWGLPSFTEMQKEIDSLKEKLSAIRQVLDRCGDDALALQRIREIVSK